MQTSDVEPDLVTMNTCIRSWESFGSTFFACSCQRFDWICNEVSRQEWQCLDTYSGWFAALMGAKMPGRIVALQMADHKQPADNF